MSSFLQCLLASIALLVITTKIPAQKKERNKNKFQREVTAEDFKPQFYDIDSSADAVCLFNIGAVHYEVFDIIFKNHTRMRLLNKKSFKDVATVRIHLRKQGNLEETLNKLEATTYNLENGKVTETKLDKSSIYRDKEENYDEVKFTFPNIKEGSIIDYSYEQSTPDPAYIPTWTFQNNNPVLWSEYTVEVPQFLDFESFSKIEL